MRCGRRVLVWLGGKPLTAPVAEPALPSLSAASFPPDDEQPRSCTCCASPASTAQQTFSACPDRPSTTSLRLGTSAHAAVVLAPTSSSQTRGAARRSEFLRRICGYATNDRPFLDSMMRMRNPAPWRGSFPTGLGDQGPRPERKFTHIPGAQLPVAMTAPMIVKVMRPINNVYSMRAHAGRATGGDHCCDPQDRQHSPKAMQASMPIRRGGSWPLPPHLRPAGKQSHRADTFRNARRENLAAIAVGRETT